MSFATCFVIYGARFAKFSNFGEIFSKVVFLPKNLGSFCLLKKYLMSFLLEAKTLSNNRKTTANLIFRITKQFKLNLTPVILEFVRDYVCNFVRGKKLPFSTSCNKSSVPKLFLCEILMRRISCF